MRQSDIHIRHSRRLWWLIFDIFEIFDIFDIFDIFHIFDISTSNKVAEPEVILGVY